jgi:Tol biopolymer transport system component
MLAPERGPEAVSRQLTSWKEIAAYLQRDVRTVQRWEKKEGLPVHRQVHDSRSSVFITTAELDAWLLQRTVSGGSSIRSPLAWWKKWRLWLGATVAAVGIGAMGAWRFPGPIDVVVRRLPLPDGLTRAGTPSWDGRFIPYRSGKQEQSEAGLLLYDTQTGQSRTLYRIPDHPRANVLVSAASPDGSQVVYMLKFELGGGELRLARSDGSGERVLLADPQYLFSLPGSWSLDSKSIVVVLLARGGADLVLMNVATGSYRVLYHAKTWNMAPFVAPQISPDGRFVAFTDAGHAFAVSTGGGAPIAVTRASAKEVHIGWTPDGRLVYQSDRSGKQDVWAVPWDGAPGEAHMLWKDLDMMIPAGTTRQGDLYFTRSAVTEGLVTAELVNGRFAAPPTPLPATRFDYGNRAPDYSPDGLLLAYVSSADSDGKDLVLRIRMLSNNSERVIRLPMPRVQQIRWYRNGASILIQGGWGKPNFGFYRVAVSAAGNKTAEVSPVIEGLALEDSTNPTFSLDGTSLYFKQAGAPGTVERLDLATGRRSTVLQVQSDWLRLFALSPDQKQIAYDVQVPDIASHQLFVRDLAGGNPRLLMLANVEQPMGGLIWADPDTILFHRVDKSKVSDRLLRIPVDGSAPSELAATGIIARVAVHPDGRHVVWESDTNGQDLAVIQGLLR